MYMTIAVVFVVFLLLVKFVFDKYYTEPKDERKFQDVANANTRGEDLPIYMFHVNWCPHCKTALPEWNTFKTATDDKIINGYKVKCKEINCTDDKNATLSDKYNVESYPTVIMQRGEDKIDFDSKVTQSSLTTFTNTMLNN